MGSTKGSNKASPSGSRGSPQTHLPYARTSCDMCKRMKIKCERNGESCVHCVDSGAKCEITIVRRKKPMKKHENALLGVESRIDRIESVLMASGLDLQNPERNTDAVKTEAPANQSDRLSTLITDEPGSSYFVGASSGFSLFSPQGLQWISERTESNDLSQFISSFARGNDGPAAKGSADLWHTMSPSEREPLPPRELAEQYVKSFFDTFNSVFPLYDRKTFYENYKIQYSGKPPGGPAWYASFNIVISIGSMILQVDLRDTSSGGRKDLDEDRSWKYFRNACSCFVDLIFKDCNLMAVQAICGMAFVQQIASGPKSVFVLTAAASRLAHAIGLHQKMDGFKLSQTEIDQRRNVFWITYFLDKSISLRVGHPSVISDDDIGVDLPQEKSFMEENPGRSNKYDVFRYRTQLALLESRIYSDLYSVRSQNKTKSERLVSIGKLDQALQEWRQVLPVEIRPEETIQCADGCFTPVAMMHLAYFNCLSTIHRSSIHHGSWTSHSVGHSGSKSGDLQFNPRVYASYSISLAAARNSIQLLQRFDSKDLRYNSLVLIAPYYPLSSFLALFANTLQNPQNTCVGSDLKLMGLVVSILTPMATRGRPSPTTVAIEVFRELGNVAAKFVEQTNSHKIKISHAHDKYNLNQEEHRPSLYESETVDSLSCSTTDLEKSRSMNFSADDPNSNSVLGAETSDQPKFDILHRQNVDQQRLLRLPSALGSDNLAMSAESNPVLMSNQPLFIDFFEWELANLCDGDFMRDVPDL